MGQRIEFLYAVAYAVNLGPRWAGDGPGACGGLFCRSFLDWRAHANEGGAGSSQSPSASIFYIVAKIVKRHGFQRRIKKWQRALAVTVPAILVAGTVGTVNAKALVTFPFSEFHSLLARGPSAMNGGPHRGNLFGAESAAGLTRGTFLQPLPFSFVQANSTDSESLSGQSPAAPLQDESFKSAPPDTTPYVRPILPEWPRRDATEVPEASPPQSLPSDRKPVEAPRSSPPDTTPYVRPIVPEDYAPKRKGTLSPNGAIDSDRLPAKPNCGRSTSRRSGDAPSAGGTA